MLFSRANLAVAKIAAKGSAKRVLNGVHFSEDGSTVAANGRMVLAVGPVDASRVKFPDLGGDASPGAEGVTVETEVVDQAVKNLPRDRTPSAQHVMMTECGGKVELTTVSRTREQRVAGRPVPDRFPSWRDVIRKAKRSASSGRVCLNRRDLIQMLEAVDSACPDKGSENPVFVEFGGEKDGIVVRSLNYDTGQQAVGFVMPLDTGGKWLPQNGWVKRLFSFSAKRRIPKD